MVDVKRAPFLAMQQNQQHQHQQQKQYHKGKAERASLITPTLPWTQQDKGSHSTPLLAVKIDTSERATYNTMASPSSASSQPNATLRPKDERRAARTNSQQIETDSSPSGSSAGLESAASAVANGSESVALPKSQPSTFRSSSIFRLGRKSFGRKKSSQEKAAAPIWKMVASLESQRSRGSLGSLTGWNGKSTSQASSSAILQNSPSLSVPVRESLSSSQGGGDSISDFDGNRASSDQDSIRGNGKMVWGRNRSSLSLLGDQRAEGLEATYRPHQSVGRLSLASSGVLEQDESLSGAAEMRPATKSRFQVQRSFSSSSVPTEGRSAPRYSSSPALANSPGTTRNVSALASLSSASQMPTEPLPPTPRIASDSSATKNHYQAQRVLRPDPLVETAIEYRPDSATLVPFKAKRRTMMTGMVDDEVDDNPRRDDHLDLYQFLGSNGQSPDGKSTQQSSLEVPEAGNTVRGVLRKTRSQSSFILNRRPSFLGGKQKNDGEKAEEKQQRVVTLPQVGKKDTKTRQSPRRTRPPTSESVTDTASESISSARLSPTNSIAKRSPWDKMFASRLEFNDSSPEVEIRQPFFAFSRQARSGSASSMDKEVSTYASKAGRSRKGSISANTSRPGSPLAGSRLDSSGGAANLFGSSSSTPRQRASSLLPLMSWSRPRTSSNADLVSSSTNDTGTLSSSDPKSSSEKEKTPATIKVDSSQFDGNANEFVRYVLAKVPRTDYSAVLASSGDELHRQALHIYMQQFYFAGNPLDIALRKLLMSVCLPKETQQIDRVMEAFARRYNECNERLFTTDDQPYVLAFSLMMLHTDAFNRNAKQKMTKQDYLRNTASSGVRDEILEYLYDNLTFTQFIYVEDDESLSRKKTESEASNSGSFMSAFASSTSSSSKNRIDPYYIIASGQTHTLRADISHVIAEDSPFSAKGTAAEYDIEALNRTFVNAPSIEIVTTRRPSLTAAAALGSESLSTSFGAIEKEQETVVTLRVTKVGCISRKDDIIDDNKKAQSRKWKTCGMVLSSSQLLFFKDLVWTSALDQQIKEQTSQSPNQEGGVLITPRITYFRPDGVLALGDAIAMRDMSYKKYEYVVRLIARRGDQSRQYLIQTGNEAEMNDWIHKINFCAAFRASGLRIRGLDPPSSPTLDNGSTAAFSFSAVMSNADGDTEKTASSPPSSPGLSMTSGGSAGSGGVPKVGLMRRKLNARRQEVMPKLTAVSLKYRESHTQLEEALRFARHLGILTPFMKVTRDRIEATAVPLSQRIRQLRLDVARYGSRREMLQLELDAGDRAARATASPSSFSDVPRDEEKISTAPISLSALPSPMIDANNNSILYSQQQREAEIDEGNLATPRVHTISIGEEQRSTLEAGLSPAMIMRQHSSPPHSSSHHLMSDEPSLDDILGHVLGAPLFLDQQSTTSSSPSSSENSKRTRSPPPRRFKHSNTPREEAERWDRSKVVKDSKRVSLVTLPDAEHLKDLSRLSMSHAMNIKLEERNE